MNWTADDADAAIVILAILGLCALIGGLGL